MTIARISLDSAHDPEQQIWVSKLLLIPGTTSMISPGLGSCRVLRGRCPDCQARLLPAHRKPNPYRCRMMKLGGGDHHETVRALPSQKCLGWHGHDHVLGMVITIAWGLYVWLRPCAWYGDDHCLGVVLKVMTMGLA